MAELERVLEGIERIDTKVEKLDRTTGEFQLAAVQRLSRIEEKLEAHPDPAVCSRNFARIEGQVQAATAAAGDAKEHAAAAERRIQTAAGIVKLAMTAAVAGVGTAIAATWAAIKGE